MSTQSVISVCLLAAAVCVRAQLDEEAPHDLVEAPEEETPAPVAEGNTLSFCFDDAECRVNDDPAAACVNRNCQCSAGFGPYTYMGTTLHGCFASTEDHSVRRRRSQQGRFPLGNFRALTPLLKSEFLSLWERTTERKVIDAFFSKGSVNYVINFEASDNELIELAGTKSKLIQAIQEVPELNRVLTPDSLSVATAAGGQEECKRDNAAEAIVVEGVCHAQQCNDGYQPYTASSGVQICVARTRDVDDDDDLSKGEIAGIIIACVVVAALLAAAIAFVCKANTPKSHNEQQVFANSPKNVTSPDQENAEATTLVPVDPVAAGHSLYTAPYGDGDMEAQSQSQFPASNVAIAEA